MIDDKGYRPNVAIVIVNNDGQVFWARRVGNQDAWQFPQGGIQKSETPEEALYRELREETGLKSTDVTILAQTKDWLHYDLPEGLVRRFSKPVCLGQKQIWFLLRLESEIDAIQLDASETPEFDEWKWIGYQQALSEVVSFKKAVYQQAFDEISVLMPDLFE